MATTNTLLRDTAYVIDKAWRLIKKKRPGDDMEPEEDVAALEHLQDIMISMGGGNTPCWKRETVALGIVAGQGMYEIDALFRARDVHHVQWESGVAGNSYQITKLSKHEYQLRPNKSTAGAPAEYMCDKSPTSLKIDEAATDTTADANKMYLWPVPTAATIAAGAEVYMEISRPYEVPTLDTDEIDLPQDWHNALIHKLAAALFTEFGGDSSMILHADKMWEDKLDEYRPEYVDIVIAQ